MSPKRAFTERLLSPQSTRRVTVTLEYLLDRFAFCPQRSRPVVPIVTDDPSAGMTFDAFKKDNKKYQGEGSSPLAEQWLGHRSRLTVADLRMRPDRPRPTYEEAGEIYINTYRPPEHKVSGRPVGPFIEFVEHLLPDARERAWFWNWLAYKFQNPGVPGPGVVMVAREFGTGRGTLFRTLEGLFGEQYIASPKFDAVVGATYQGQYNEWQADSLIVCINESKERVGRGSYAAGIGAYEALKDLVDPSARKVLITRKGLPNYSGWTYSSFIIATNHRDAIAIPEKDRRFAVLSNGTTMSAAIRHSINDFLSDQSNVSSLAHYLAGYDTGDYDPYALPIATSAKTAMADFARSDLDRALDEALDPSTYDGRAHLSGEIFTIAQALRAVSSAAASQDLKLPEGGWHPIAKKELEKRCARVGERDGRNWRPTIRGVRTPVYARTKEAADSWTSAPSRAVEAEVEKNE